jgi:pyruvate carboxylase
LMEPCAQSDGARVSVCCSEVFFETNGIPRLVEVTDTRAAATTAAKRAARERADPTVLGSVSAPMAGEVIEVKAKPGEGRPRAHTPPKP